ncbi:MAG: type II CAAX endopeptidase family protein [Candidatus Humimicrobiaceae bacterium]
MDTEYSKKTDGMDNKRWQEYFPWKYILVAFGFSWIIWLPGILASKGFFQLPISYTLLTGIGAFGPLVAAFLLTSVKYGKKGIIELLKRSVSIGFRKIWLIPALLLMPVLVGSTLVIYILFEGKAGLPEFTLISQPWLIIPLFFLSFFALGAIQEEFGWRGYALDLMQKKWNALLSSLMLGIIWAIWHLPLFFIQGTMQSKVPFYIFLLSTLGVTVIYTWLYNNTKRSILIVLLFHAMHNTSFNIFPITLLPSPGKALLYLTGLQLLVAIIIVCIWGPSKMTKHELDFKI